MTGGCHSVHKVDQREMVVLQIRSVVTTSYMTRIIKAAECSIYICVCNHLDMPSLLYACFLYCNREDLIQASIVYETAWAQRKVNK